MSHEYLLSVMYLNIVSYIYLNFAFFAILFIFDTKAIVTLSDIKVFGNLQFFAVTIILIFMSFSGVPPTLGFVSKSIIIIFLFYKLYKFFFNLFLYKKLKVFSN